MRSASRIRVWRAGLLRPLAVAACVCLLGAGAAGCSTTQEKAEHQKARAEHILKARAERKAAKRHHKAGGPNTGHQGKKSAHRRGESK